MSLPKWFLCLFLSAAPLAWAAAADLPLLHAKGTGIVDAQDRPVILKGCNLGNWLVLETWMFQWYSVPDQYELEKLLTQRFGPEQKNRWMDQYRQGFVQDRDFELIRSFGFNCVRLPVHYNLVLDDEPPYALRKDAFRWIDHALEMAERHGVYVILDLHAAPGSQSVDHNSGRSGQNHLWSSPEAQKAFVEFWRQTAKRYAGRSVVAAYDLLNEPYGDYRADLRQPMLLLTGQAYDAIRASDSSHLILFSGLIGHGIGFYDTPAMKLRSNVGFTEHFYPGLFGSPGTLTDMSRFLKYEMDDKAAQLERLGGPFLAGEFNTVIHEHGGVYVTRMQYDRYARNGWAATLWSHKILKPQPGVGTDNWYTVTNADPMPTIDPRTSSREQIDAYFDAVGKVALVADDKLRLALTSPQPPKLSLPELPEIVRTAPPDTPLAPWTSKDIGGAARGALVTTPEGLKVFSAGADIYGRQDSFRFVYQQASGDLTIQTTLRSFSDTHEFAKAGIMLRASDAPNAPHLLLHAFPDGTICLASRVKAGEITHETKTYMSPLPVHLRLRRSGQAITASFSSDGSHWQQIGASDDLPVLPAQCLAGLAVTSHRDRQLATALFANTRLGEVTDHLDPIVRPEAGLPNLLGNPSFENPGTPADQPAGWNRWGDEMRRQEASSRTGNAFLGYRHAQVAGNGDSGLWQDASVTAGKTYTFSIYANCDRPAGTNSADRVTLVLESTVDGRQMAIASKSYPAAQLATGDAWSHLVISGPAAGDRLRVLVRIAPSADKPRGGAVRLDDASLTCAP